jgi:hypothetical protein
MYKRIEPDQIQRIFIADPNADPKFPFRVLTAEQARAVI